MMENMTNITTPSVHHNYLNYYNKYDHDNDDYYDYWEDYYEQLKKRSDEIDIICLVVYILVFVLGVLGNGVVIWATGFRMKKTVSTVWYLNLAVADFLATAFLPLKITERALDNNWPFGAFMCKMDTMVFHLNMYASIFTLTVISVDRCVSVVCPLWAKFSGYRTVRKASWVSLAVWLLALALSIPELIYRSVDGAEYEYSDMIRCYDYDILGFAYFAPRLEALVITNIVVGFVIPFSIIVSCYSVIIYWLRNNRPLASQSGRSFKIIGTVISAFFVCWVPFHIIRIIRVVHVLDDTSELYWNEELPHVLAVTLPITLALALINSCLNPLLYVFSQGFKNVFRSRSILKVLEKAFDEEPTQTENIPTDPDVSLPELNLSVIEGSTGLSGTQEPPGHGHVGDTGLGFRDSPV